MISDSFTFRRFAFLRIFSLSSAGTRAITVSVFLVGFFIDSVSFLFGFRSCDLKYHAFRVLQAKIEKKTEKSCF
jgi:hypothetical protein